MLVFTRKKNESFAIGGDPPLAVLTILDIRGRKVRVGIEADRTIPVDRSEVYEKKFGKKLPTRLPQPSPPP